MATLAAAFCAVWFVVNPHPAAPASIPVPPLVPAQRPQEPPPPAAPAVERHVQASDAGALPALRLAIRDTKNLRATLDKLRVLPDPTGEISYLLMLALIDCLPYTAQGQRYLRESAQKQPDLVHRLQRQALIEERTARCATFESIPDISTPMAELDAKAVASRHPGALARKVMRSLYAEGVDAADAMALPLLEQSADPNVLHHIQDYLLQRNGRTLLPGQGIWSNQGQAAWLLLQCDLGRDCSGGSMIMVRECAVNGHCGTNDVYEMARDSWLTPDEYAKALAMKQELLEALRDKDWARLGFVPLSAEARERRSR